MAFTLPTLRRERVASVQAGCSRSNDSATGTELLWIRPSMCELCVGVEDPTLDLF
jgi:hypothetical protein